MFNLGEITSKDSTNKATKELVCDIVNKGSCPGLVHHVRFSKNNDRIYFISGGALMSSDLKDVKNHLEPVPLVTGQTSSQESMSKEEILRRERMRESLNSITSFEYHQEEEILLIPGSSLHLYDIKQKKIKDLSFKDSTPRVDGKLSPSGKNISYIMNNDIYVYSIKDCTETQVTFGGDPCDRRTNGVAEYIIQEEFDRYTGYYWSPIKTKEEILFAVNDLTSVEEYHIPEHSIEGKVDTFLYPRVGTENAISNLAITSITKTDVEVKTLVPSLKERFPWMEYLVRFGWTSTDEEVYVQLLDRKQERTILALIKTDQFKANSDSSQSSDIKEGVSVIYEEKSDIWINVSDLIYFYKDGSKRMLFSTEKTGFRHLIMLIPQTDGKYAIQQVTKSHDWLVDPDFLEVDEKRDLVYFKGTVDTPLEEHLYSASTSTKADPSVVVRMTSSKHNHSQISLNSDMTMFATCFSNLSELHKTQIYRIYENTNETGRYDFPPSSAIIYSFPKTIDSFKLSKIDLNTQPEIFHFKNSKGYTIYGCYFKPRNFDPSRKYPTVLKVYGGPHVQRVVNDQSLKRRNLSLLMYAHMGYLCVMIDGAGSWRRGLKFEGHLKRSMGTFEVQEQVEGLSYLIKKGLVDTERIAVTGWSYGGYLSLLCLAQRPDFFKVAISGAPVIRWEAYDTGYTERYMDVLQDNLSGYKKGSVLEYIDGIPAEPNRLLLLHGVIDDNVHFCHTLELIQSLIDHGKSYDLQVYPKERHGLRNLNSRIHCEIAVLRYLMNYL